MKDWTRTFSHKMWLQPDHTGEEDAALIRDVLCLEKDHAVLDAPCGAGRISIRLARMGCQVTGVDLQKLFVQRAKRRFKKEGLKGSFHCMDLRKLSFQDAFDVVVCWNGSFGYFSDEENMDVLHSYARALKGRGCLLIDVPNRENLLRHFKKCIVRDHIEIHNQWDAETERVNAEWILKKKDVEEHHQMSMRLYTPFQLCYMFARIGLKVEARYGAVTGKEYTTGSPRLIVVGRK